MLAEVAFLHRHAGREFEHALQARLSGPDFGVFEVEAEQDEFGIILAAFVPGGDEAVPQPVDRCPVVVERERAVDAGEEVVVLGREMGEGRRSAARRGSTPIRSDDDDDYDLRSAGVRR